MSYPHVANSQTHRHSNCFKEQSGRSILSPLAPSYTAFKRPSRLSSHHHKSIVMRTHWIEDTWYLERYGPGGYHTVVIGDVLGDRYQIVDKLGCGGCSTVWLARDVDRSIYVALKSRHIGFKTWRDGGPGKICPRPGVLLPPNLVASSGQDAIPPVLDKFTASGPNGVRLCHSTTLAQCSLGEGLASSPIQTRCCKGVTCS